MKSKSGSFVFRFAARRRERVGAIIPCPYRKPRRTRSSRAHHSFARRPSRGRSRFGPRRSPFGDGPTGDDAAADVVESHASSSKKTITAVARARITRRTRLGRRPAVHPSPPEPSAPAGTSASNRDETTVRRKVRPRLVSRRF